MRYKCIVSYDGSSYNGYQKQKHDKNTIQEVIENVLSQLFKEKIVIYGSGRTDKHVHALAQVFHFDSTIKIPVKNLLKAANEMLPDSIQLKSVCKVNETFHARYSAHQKIYLYKIKRSAKKDVFDDRYYCYLKEDIDLNRLKEASRILIGTHDFKNFTTNKIDEVESFVKTIYDIKITANKSKINLEFYGSGFLRYQVRMMVGALLVVATNKKDLVYLQNLISDKCNEKCSYKASPNGLYLKKVIY